MKKLLLLALTAFSMNAQAQLNLKWSHTQSLSGGVYKSVPKGSYVGTDDVTIVASNDYFEPTGEYIKGHITKYDAAGNLQWNLTLSPAVSLANFLNGGIVNNLQGIDYDNEIVVAYNTTPTTSHLIKINSNGTIAWDIVVNGINNISSIYDDTSGTWVYGRTPQTTCGANQCNGIAVAKYDFTGQPVWIQTRYTTGGNIVEASDLSLTNSGDIIVCGKKASYTGGSNDRDPFVLKYSAGGTLLWSKEFIDATSDLPSALNIANDGGDEIYLAYTTSDLISSVKKTILKKLNTAGTVQFTKTINNAALINMYNTGDEWPILATSIGMKAYNASGTLIWSNGYQVVQINLGSETWHDVISKNVNPLEPLKNYLVQLNASTGAVIYQKDLSVNEVYLGGYCGLQGIDYDNEFMMLINDTTAPYGTKVTKLSPCSDFTYAFSASIAVTNESGPNCNNGIIQVNLSGTFNSWAHIELYNSANVLQQQVDISTSGAANYIFQNLTSGNYTVKMFDESCGEQNLSVTVKCPAPVSGFTVSFPGTTKATLAWNAVNCAAGYSIQYRLSGAVNWTTVTSNINNKTITGLTKGTTYQWKVATKCSGTNPVVYSDYSSLQTFTQGISSNSKQITLYNNEGKNLGISTESLNDNAKPEFSIYPNPGYGDFIVSLNLTNDDVGDKIIQVINMSGQVIKRINVHDQTKLNINIKEQGVYFIQLKTGKQTITKKLVVIQ